MSLNTIEKQDPASALLASIRGLEKQFSDTKASQAPTIYKSTIGFVNFTIAPLDANFITQQFPLVVYYTHYPDPQVLFAIPSVTFYSSAAVNDAAGHFPDGSYWSQSGNKQYQEILTFDWWNSWGLNDDHNMALMFNVVRQDYGSEPTYGVDNNPDGTTPATLSCYMYVQLRSISPKLH